MEDPLDDVDVTPDPDALPAVLVARLRSLETNMLSVYDHFVVAAAAKVLEARDAEGSSEWPPSRQMLDDQLAESIMLAGELLLAAAFLRHGREDMNDVWTHIMDDVETALLKGQHRGIRIDSTPWET